MKPEDIKKLPTPETGGFRAILIAHGQAGAHAKMCSLEQRLAAAVMVVEQFIQGGWRTQEDAHLPDEAKDWDNARETLASIRSMK